MEEAILALYKSKPKSWKSQRELFQKMIDTCINKELDCPICLTLMARIDAMGKETGAAPSVAVNSTEILKAEQSLALRHQFARFTPIMFYSQKSSSSFCISNDAQQINADYGPAAAASKQTLDPELTFALNRESRCLSTDIMGFDKSMPLRYGLHQLIRDVEQSNNHRMVFSRLTPTQLNSLLAQITCEQTLWKDVDGDGAASLRLLQIEQELNDLMARDDSGREPSEQALKVGGTTVTYTAKNSGRGFTN